MKSLTPMHLELVGSVMDMQLKRQNVIVSNIANVNTPKYKPRELEFEDQLQAALGLDMKGKVTTTSEKHLPATFDPQSFQPEWFKKFVPKDIHGEDRVNLDQEISKMAKNNLQYSALSQVTKSGFDGIKSIIQESQRA